jgi:hypothetical protein
MISVSRSRGRWITSIALIEVGDGGTVGYDGITAPRIVDESLSF